jgi:uncharacterized membrane protein (DUF373 family)
MATKRAVAAEYARWKAMPLYEQFEQAIVFILVALIAVVIIVAVWSLALKVLFALVLSDTFDPTDHEVFQSVFGAMFTVIIALEFKRSLLIAAERRHSIVQVRAVVLIAILAIVRKLIIIDLGATEAAHLFALAAAMLALGAVYWLVRDQDSRERLRERTAANT